MILCKYIVGWVILQCNISWHQTVRWVSNIWTSVTASYIIYCRVFFLSGRPNYFKTVFLLHHSIANQFLCNHPCLCRWYCKMDVAEYHHYTVMVYTTLSLLLCNLLYSWITPYDGLTSKDLNNSQPYTISSFIVHLEIA